MRSIDRGTYGDLAATRAVVGAVGFEPTTSCSQSMCATRLRYAPRTGANSRSIDRGLRTTMAPPVTPGR